MSTIKLELTVDANNIEIVTEFLGRIAVASVGGKKVNELKVVDAEEVKAPEAEKPAPKPRPSRAKSKPQPEPEEDEDEDLDEDLDDEGLEDEEEAEEETIDADDLRAKQAEKVAAHRAAIKAKLTELGATGIKDLDEKHYQKYFDFLSKLK
jgi:hypothetical protein